MDRLADRLAQFQNALAERRVPALAELHARSVLDKAGRPHVVAGNNALVARLRRADGGDVALRIVASGRKDREMAIRYAALAEFQLAHSLSRLPAAINRIQAGVPALAVMGMDTDRDATGSTDVFAISMEWITGPTLLQGVDRAANAGNAEVIRALAGAFVQCWNDLQRVDFIHGDYTAQNLLVRSNGQLACVDLDGAAWNEAPFGPTGEGTPGYRHPTLYRDASLRDAFAALVIVTSLAVIADAPELRTLYGDPPSAIDGSLLFSAWDLADPSISRAFADATERATPPTRALLEGLQNASTGYAADVYDACGLLPRMKMPSRAMFEAASADSGWDTGWDIGPVVDRMRAHYSDTWITGAPTAEEANAGFMNAPASAAAPPEPVDGAVYAASATENVTGDDIAELTTALRRNDEAEVVRIWSQIGHDPLARLLAGDVEQVIAAGYDRRVLSESRRKRDSAVLAVSAEAHDRQIPLGPQARVVVRQANERTAVRAELAAALARGDRLKLAELAVSGQLVVLGDADRQSLQLVLQAIEWPALQRAIQTDDDVLIASAFDDELFEGSGLLDSGVTERVNLARRRVQWLGAARAALAKRDTAQLRELLIDPPEGAPERLSSPERRRIRRAIERRHAVAELESAIQGHDEGAIIVALNRVERVGARISDRATWARVQQVVERVSIIDELLSAAEAQPLDHVRIAQLIPALKALGLERDPRLGDDQLVERLEAHVIRMAHVRRIRSAIARDNDLAIVVAAVPDPRNALDMLSEPERDRVAAAIKVQRNAERIRT